MEENKEIIENNEVNEENKDSSSAMPDVSDTPKTDDASENGKNKEEEGSILRDTIEIIESTLATVFVIVLVFTYLLHPVNIVGRSMVPTLNNNYNGEREQNNDTDKVFMSTVFFDVKYGDILIIDKDKNYLLDGNGNAYQPSTDPCINECIIKRVIACGGQTVDLVDGEVVVDGKVIDEPYIAEDSHNSDQGSFSGQYPITIPEGYYFVMGDNRDHSSDSRSRSVGLVKKDQIYGKAIIKYHPLNEFKILVNSWKGDK